MINDFTVTLVKCLIAHGGVLHKRVNKHFLNIKIPWLTKE